MLKKSLFLPSILSVFISAGASAAGFEMGVGYAGYEKPFDLDDSKGPKVNLGYRFKNNWGLELSHAHIEAVVENNGDEYFDHTALNTLYHFGEGHLQSYILAGAGGYAGNAGLSAAFGLKLRMGRLEVRPEFGIVKALSESNGEDTVDTMASLTFSILFGSQSKAKEIAVVVPKSVAPPADTDGDTIIDTADRCPETPLGAAIDSMGCALDTDKDGIIDYFDKCQSTEVGLKVDDKGCPKVLEEDITLNLNVNFDSGSSVVNARYFREISKAANFLEEYPNTTVIIEGHTDTRGSAAANKTLSQKRANAVAKVLINIFKVSSDRVSSRGYGEERPIADESTQIGLLKNRRVVANIKTVVESFERN